MFQPRKCARFAQLALAGLSISCSGVAENDPSFWTPSNDPGGKEFGGFGQPAGGAGGDTAAGGFGGAAVLILLIGMVNPGPFLLATAMATAGFLSGMIAPSRDMLVRAASPPGAFGRVFGIVTTGFNIGGTVGPLIGGWIMDHNVPRWVFFSSVVFMALTAAMGLASEWRSRRRDTLAGATG